MGAYSLRAAILSEHIYRMKKFGLIGASGFIAPRHMKAIKDTGNVLVASLDPFDSVGILDSYFPRADFFTEFERFDRHIEKLRREGRGVDFISICTPNYLHDAHIRFGLRNHADVICEKPLVLNPWNVDALTEMEKETGNRVYCIFQLRLHPAIIALRNKITAGTANKIHQVNLSYITARGNWYQRSWKGDIARSGGIATNIGVHIFDMFIWIFGGVLENHVILHSPNKAAGYLLLKNAKVNWSLSIDEADLPEKERKEGKRTYRSLTIDEENFEFSDGFTDLHTESYKEILAGNGFGLEDVKAAISIVHDIRNCKTAN